MALDACAVLCRCERDPELSKSEKRELWPVGEVGIAVDARSVLTRFEGIGAAEVESSEDSWPMLRRCEWWSELGNPL